MSDDARPLLEIRALTVEFNGRKAVDDLYLELFPAQVTALVGESGSGKTMTALAMLDLLPDEARRPSGKVLFKGIDIYALPEERKRRMRGRSIAMVFQEPFSALNPLLRVGTQIEETLTAHEMDVSGGAASYTRQLLRMVKLDGKIADSYPHELSGGMRQRVILAMALSCDPEVLILDEPTTALDVFTQKEMIDLVLEIQKERSIAALFITHDFSVVKMVADNVAVMRDGRIVERGTRKKVLLAPEDIYTKHLLECVPRLGDKRRRLPIILKDRAYG